MKRLGIYFFFDKDGVVDAYVPYYLKHLKSHCSELCVVVNKPLKTAGEQTLKAVCDKLIVRENIGFDSGAYKAALEYYGYEKLKEYDELILCNFTCYGPVYPFEEMFEKMAQTDVDFWGNAWFPRVENVRFCAQQKTDYIPEHIMSYFMVIRHKMLSSDDFKHYWQTLQTATSYAEAIVVNELRFTDYFTHCGFKGDAFVPKALAQKANSNVDVYLPVNCLQVRSPLVKRRVFFSSYDLLLANGRGTETRKTLEYLQKYTSYDVNLIWDNLLRTQPGSVLKRNFHLNYFLSETHFTGDENQLKENRVALLCCIYDDDMVEYCAHYAANLPSWADIFVVTASKTIKETVRKRFSQLPNRLEVRLKANRGQLASAVLIAGKDIFEKYDVVCVTQVQKTPSLQENAVQKAFCDHYWQSVLQSSPYVLNVLQAFQVHPRLGYACAIPPHWGTFSQLCGKELTDNKQFMQRVLHELYHISVPFDEEPVASYGGCYWVRGKAYKTLLSRAWKYEEFPPDSVPKTGTVLPALERLNPLFVQYDGFYSAWMMPKSLVSTYFDNIYYYYRSFMQQDLAPMLLPEFSYTTQKDMYRLLKLKMRYFKYKLLKWLTLGHSKKFNERLFELKMRIAKAKRYKNICLWRQR